MGDSLILHLFLGVPFSGGNVEGSLMERKYLFCHFSFNLMALVELPWDRKPWLLLGEVKNNPIIGAVLSTKLSMQNTTAPFCRTSPE